MNVCSVMRMTVDSGGRQYALESRELLRRAGNCSGEPGSDQGRQDVIVRENNIVLGIGTSSGRSLRRLLPPGHRQHDQISGSVIITAAA